MGRFIVYTVAFTALLYVAAMLLGTLLDNFGLLILGMILGGAVLASVFLLWEKLGQIDQKLDELLKKRDEHDV